jgi:hypothetical protein
MVDQGRQEVDAVLYQIVLEKLRSGSPLSRDEEWFYLTGILRVSQVEAEQIAERLRLGRNGELCANKK